MSTTIRERLRGALEARGWKYEYSTGRYWVMIKAQQKKLFLGEAGALRQGTSPTTSRSLTDSGFYKDLLAQPIAAVSANLEDLLA